MRPNRRAIAIGFVTACTALLTLKLFAGWTQRTNAIKEATIHLTAVSGATLQDRTLNDDKAPSVDAAGNQYICDVTGLYKVDKNGKLLWSFRRPQRTIACFVEPTGRSYQSAFDGQLFALSPNGEVLWSQVRSGSANFGSLIGDGKGVWAMIQYRPGERDRLKWIDSAEADKDYGSYPENSQIYRSPDGTLFVISPTENGDRTIWKIQPF